MQSLSSLTRCMLLLLACLPGYLQAEPLRVGFGEDRPPYVMERKQTGLEIEIVTRAAALVNMQVVPVFSNSTRAQWMLQHGEIDARSSVRSPVSESRVSYSEPYIEYQDCVFALAGRKLAIHSVADLRKYSVSAFPQAHQLLGPEFSAMARVNPSYAEYDDEKMRTLLLYTGRTDVLVGDRYIFDYFKNRLGDVSRANVSSAVSVYPLWAPVPFQLAFVRASQRDRFNRGLRALHQSGEYAHILKKYTPGRDAGLTASR
jgi:polar amino acid transport system substrate-binding protein